MPILLNAPAVIDLQSHSTVSDGELPPAEVVAAAAKAGVTTLALTDHDAVDGIPEADAAARDTGVALVPASEISCIHASIDDLHMLGYWIDVDAMRPMCERAQQERVTRAGEIVAKLNSLGVEVSFEDAIAQAGDASSVGRPHIAKAAGTKPEEMSAFFEEYLVPGAKAFVSRRWPTAHEATALIASLLGHQGAGRCRGPDRRPRPGRSRMLLPRPRPRPDQVPARDLPRTWNRRDRFL